MKDVYSYDEVFRSVNKICNELKKESNNENLFRDFLILVRYFYELKKIYNKRDKLQGKKVRENNILYKNTINYIFLKRNEKTKRTLQEYYFHKNLSLNRFFQKVLKFQSNDSKRMFKEIIEDYIFEDLIDLFEKQSDSTFNYDVKNLLDNSFPLINFVKILSYRLDEIIDIFVKINSKSTKPYSLPKSFKSNILNTLYLKKEISSIDKSDILIMGSCSADLISNYISKFNHKQKEYLKDASITFSVEESKRNLKLYKIIHSFSLTKDLMIYDEKIDDIDFIESKKSSQSHILTITPYKLNDVYREELLGKIQESDTDRLGRWEYPLSSNNLEPFIYYKNSLYMTKEKTYILVPETFISPNDYYKYSDEDFYEFNLDGIFERNIRNEKIIECQNFQKIIESKNISRVIKLPNQYFFHTKEPQVLLEVSKEEVEGVYFIDLCDYFVQNKYGYEMKYNPTPDFRKILETMLLTSEKKDIFLSSLEKNVKNEKTIVKYVDYEDIIYKFNYKFLPQFYLNNNSLVENEQVLLDSFDVKKLQRFSFKSGDMFLGQVSLSDFVGFGFTSSIKSKTFFQPPWLEKKFCSIQKYYKFKESYQIQKYDILIYVHDITKIAIIDVSDDANIVGTHNLIRIRVKKSHNKAEYAKKLYLFFKSDLGQKSLEKILLTSKNTRKLISVNELERLNIGDLSSYSSKKFDLISKKINLMNWYQKMIDKEVESHDGKKLNIHILNQLDKLAEKLDKSSILKA